MKTERQTSQFVMYCWEHNDYAYQLHLWLLLTSTEQDKSCSMSNRASVAVIVHHAVHEVTHITGT
jgi:hypothetical protein